MSIPKWVNEFTVSRSTWYRGEGSTYSRLLRSDGKMCCVGFLCKAMGMTDKDIMDKPEVKDTEVAMPNGRLLHYTEAFSPLAESAHILNEAYEVNDSEIQTDKWREAEITKLFKTVNIDVHFVP